jgi:hypothetical protein
MAKLESGAEARAPNASRGGTSAGQSYVGQKSVTPCPETVPGVALDGLGRWPPIYGRVRWLLLAGVKDISHVSGSTRGGEPDAVAGLVPIPKAAVRGERQGAQGIKGIWGKPDPI